MMSSPNQSQHVVTKNDNCNDVADIAAAAVSGAAAGSSEKSGGGGGDENDLPTHVVCVGSICGRLSPLHALGGGGCI